MLNCRLWLWLEEPPWLPLAPWPLDGGSGVLLLELRDLGLEQREQRAQLPARPVVCLRRRGRRAGLAALGRVGSVVAVVVVVGLVIGVVVVGVDVAGAVAVPLEVVLVVVRLTNSGGRRERTLADVPELPPAPDAAPAVGAERAVDRRDQLRPGQEHDLPERERAGRRLAERLLEQLDADGRGGLPDVVDDDPVGVEAEAREIAVELEHVGAVGDPRREVPVGGRAAVHQDHRFSVDLVQRPAGLDLLADLREPGDRAAQAVVDGLGIVVAERARLGVGLGQVAALDGRGAGGLARVGRRRSVTETSCCRGPRRRPPRSPRAAPGRRPRAGGVCRRRSRPMTVYACLSIFISQLSDVALSRASTVVVRRAH